MAETYDTAALPDRMTQFVPHAAALGMELVSIGHGQGVMRAAWREELVGDPETDVIAGGVVTALIDHTCGLAVNSANETPMPIATLDLRIDYMRPAEPGRDVYAYFDNDIKSAAPFDAEVLKTLTGTRPYVRAA